MAEEIQLIDQSVMDECLELMGDSASLILEEYFNQCTGFVEELQTYIENEELIKISELAHSLKSCSYQLGFHRVGSYSEMAELQAKNIKNSPYMMSVLLGLIKDAFLASKAHALGLFPDLKLLVA